MASLPAAFLPLRSHFARLGRLPDLQRIQVSRERIKGGHPHAVNLEPVQPGPHGRVVFAERWV